MIERISQFIESKHISVRAFEVKIGASNGLIRKAIANNTDIQSKWTTAIAENYPQINPDWLLTGNGPMFRLGMEPVRLMTDDEMAQNGREVSEDRWKTDNVFALRTDRLVERQRIPVYDMEAIAGLVPLFADSYGQQVVEVIETSLIPKCDGGLRIVGDSMYPLLKSGDVVFYKQIHDIHNNIIWGEMYLISFDMEGEEYITVKYLQKSNDKDYICLVSHNDFHKPMDIHLSRVRALAFIKASLRLNSIK